MVALHSMGRHARAFGFSLIAMAAVARAADDAPRLGDLTFPHDPARWAIAVEQDTLTANCIDETACNGAVLTMTRRDQARTCDPGEAGALGRGTERHPRTMVPTASAGLAFQLVLVDPGCARFGIIVYACTRFRDATYVVRTGTDACGDFHPTDEGVRDFLGSITVAQ